MIVFSPVFILISLFFFLKSVSKYLLKSFFFLRTKEYFPYFLLFLGITGRISAL